MCLDRNDVSEDDDVCDDGNVCENSETFQL